MAPDSLTRDAPRRHPPELNPGIENSALLLSRAWRLSSSCSAGIDPVRPRTNRPAASAHACGNPPPIRRWARAAVPRAHSHTHAKGFFAISTTEPAGSPRPTWAPATAPCALMDRVSRSGPEDVDTSPALCESGTLPHLGSPVAAASAQLRAAARAGCAIAYAPPANGQPSGETHALCATDAANSG